MEFVESLSRRSNNSGMTHLMVTLLSERSNWVSVSNPLASQLQDLNALPLILQLRVLDGAGLPSKQVHHVAWCGGTLQGGGGGGSAGAGGRLGVPSALAAALGLRPGTMVQVSPLLDVPPASRVEVEPGGPDDWEVVEANAGFLEEHLLGQVGVVQRGQTLTVWARGGAACRLRVLDTAPGDLVRLTGGCELLVAPRPRGIPAFVTPAPAANGAPAGQAGQPDASGGRGPAAAVPRVGSGSGPYLAGGQREHGGGSGGGLQARPAWAGHVARPPAQGEGAVNGHVAAPPAQEQHGQQGRRGGAVGHPPPRQPGHATPQQGAAAPVPGPGTAAAAAAPAPTAGPYSAQHPQGAGVTGRESQHAAPQTPDEHLAHVAPQRLSLRVLDPPPAKYLVPLLEVLPAPSHESQESAAAAAAAAGSATWLTLAVAVAPATLSALLGLPHNGAFSQPPSSTPYLARLHGRGNVPYMVGVLVPEPACPAGHVMLAPPLQHVLGVLPHMALTVAALPEETAAGAAAAVAAEGSAAGAAAALPGLVLHPMPLPAVPIAAGPPPSLRRGPGASVSARGEDTGAPHPMAVAAATAGEAPESAGAAPLNGQALSAAVQAWLAAQLEGLRAAVSVGACGRGGLLPGPSAAAAGGGSGGAAPVQDAAATSSTAGAAMPGVLLPLVSGMVMHVRCQAGAATAASSATCQGYRPGHGAGSAVSAGCGSDYALLVQTQQRRGATGGNRAGAKPKPPAAPPPPVPVLSAGMLRAITTASSGEAQPPHQALPVSMGGPIALPAVSYTAHGHSAALAPRPRAPLPAAVVPAEGLSGLDLDLSHVSWLADQLEASLRRLLPALDPWVGAAVAAAGLPRFGGVLLTGAPGSGRSPLLAALGDVCERHPDHPAHVVHVRCGQLAGGSHSSTLSALGAAAAEALACAPSLLLLDDVDAICPSAAEGGDYGTQHPEGAAAASRLAEWLGALLDELAAAAAAAGAPAGGHGRPAAAPHCRAVAVAGSARDAGGLHAALRRVGRLDCEVRLPPPGAAGRAAMLAAAARGRGVAVAADQLRSVCGAAEGYEGADLALLLDRAVHIALREQLAAGAAGAGPNPPQSAPAAPAAPAPALAVTESHLRAAMEGFVPAPFWGVQQAAEAAGKAEGWEDVGGLGEVVAALKEALTLPIRHARLVASAPLRLRTGALLYGPPGCGKTHVVAAAVAAVAKMAPVRFLSVKGPELLNKYIGASEAAVRDLFARAAAAAPAVLFFDEFDAIAPPRGHDSTGVTDRVVNALLTELDGVGGLRGVAVLAATSRPDLVDPALLRPGRLDRALYCGPPRGEGEREQVLRALSRRLALAPDVDLAAVARQAEGLTGADLGALLSEAQLAAINEAIEAGAGGAQPGAQGPGPGPAAAGGGAHAADMDAGPAAPGSGSASDGTLVGGGRSTEAGPGGSHPTPAPASRSPAPAPSAASAASPAAILIRQRHLLRALSASRPSLPANEAARLAALYERFRSEREGPAGRRTEAHGVGGRATLA